MMQSDVRVIYMRMVDMVKGNIGMGDKGVIEVMKIYVKVCGVTIGEVSLT